MLEQLTEVIDAGPDAFTRVIRDTVGNEKAAQELSGLFMQYLAERFVRERGLDRAGFEQFLTDYKRPIIKLVGGQGYNAMWQTSAQTAALLEEGSTRVQH